MIGKFAVGLGIGLIAGAAVSAATSKQQEQLKCQAGRRISQVGNKIEHFGQEMAH